MIVALDLDDTLYEEIRFVESGFDAVAAHVEASMGVPRRRARRILGESLEREGRGSQLDDLLHALGAWSRGRVRELLHVYRHHEPRIRLPRESRAVLKALAPRRLYIVTDGHKVVQANKLRALGLAAYVEHAYLTNRYGRRHQKPSPHVFELMRRREGCDARDIVYIGDNPAKDFRGIRPLGFRTIRVRAGQHRAVRVPRGQDAEHSVESLRDIVPVIEGWERSAASRR